MFNFYRDWLATGTMEVWKILLQEERAASSWTRFEERFSPSVVVRPGDDVRYYELGFLVAIPFAEDGKERTKYFLAYKYGLSEEERATLMREVELLLGKSTHAMGNHEAQGWFVYDELHEWEPNT
jgi:hypothetical protein